MARADPLDYGRWEKVLSEIADSDDEKASSATTESVSDAALPANVPGPRKECRPSKTGELALLAAAKIIRTATMEPYWKDEETIVEAIEDFVLAEVGTAARAVELLVGKSRPVELAISGTMTRKLLELGASPDVVVQRGAMTWLHDAVDTPCPDRDSVDALLNAGPTPTKRDKDGATVLDKLLRRAFSQSDHLAYYHLQTDDPVANRRMAGDFSVAVFVRLVDMGFELDAVWPDRGSPRDRILAKRARRPPEPEDRSYGPLDEAAFHRDRQRRADDIFAETVERMCAAFESNDEVSARAANSHPPSRE